MSGHLYRAFRALVVPVLPLIRASALQTRAVVWLQCTEVDAGGHVRLPLVPDRCAPDNDPGIPGLMRHHAPRLLGMLLQGEQSAERSVNGKPGALEMENAGLCFSFFKTSVTPQAKGINWHKATRNQASSLSSIIVNIIA